MFGFGKTPLEYPLEYEVRGEYNFCYRGICFSIEKRSDGRYTCAEFDPILTLEQQNGFSKGDPVFVPTQFRFSSCPKRKAKEIHEVCLDIDKKYRDVAQKDTEYIDACSAEILQKVS